MERLKDPLMIWNMRVLDPVLRKALPWIYRLSDNTIRWFLFGLAALILVWAGRRFFTKAWGALRHGTADMNTLVALGAGTAFLYSVASTIAPGFFVAQGVAPEPGLLGQRVRAAEFTQDDGFHSCRPNGR